MTHNDITILALKSGFDFGTVTAAIYAPVSCETELMRFAVLVAAAEREKFKLLVSDKHIYNGSCPDGTNWNSRDNDCPVCRELGEWTI